MEIKRIESQRTRKGPAESFSSDPAVILKRRSRRVCVARA